MFRMYIIMCLHVSKQNINSKPSEDKRNLKDKLTQIDIIFLHMIRDKKGVVLHTLLITVILFGSRY